MHALGHSLFPNFDRVSPGEYESDNLVGDNLSYCTVQHQTSLGVTVSSEGNGINNNSVVIKKLNHNANERDRRKKTNYLFSSLRSCLPGPDERKLSIPQTISRSLQYIPELKEQVKKLIQKKEDLLVRISGQKERYVKLQPNVVVSYVSTVFATKLRDNEVMVHISSSKIHNFSIYKVLSGLEEDGFGLVNVSSSSSRGERIFYTLHFHVNKIDNYKPICEELISQRISSLYEERGNSFRKMQKRTRISVVDGEAAKKTCKRDIASYYTDEDVDVMVGDEEEVVPHEDVDVVDLMVEEEAADEKLGKMRVTLENVGNIFDSYKQILEYFVLEM